MISRAKKIVLIGKLLSNDRMLDLAQSEYRSLLQGMGTDSYVQDPTDMKNYIVRPRQEVPGALGSAMYAASFLKEIKS
jgi:hypothetical protein